MSSLPPGLSPEQIATIQYLDKITVISQIYYAAILAVTLYDWLLHLPDEYRLIWKSQWSAGKVIYLLVRYTTCIPAAVFVTWSFYTTRTTDQCRPVVRADAFLACIVILSCEAVLFLRCYSIWNKSKWILAYLTAHFLLTAVFVILNAAKYVTPVPYPLGSGPCIPLLEGFGVSYWISVMTFEVCVTVLITAKSIMLLKAGTAGRSFLQHFARDGVFYGLAVVALDLLNIVFILQSANVFIRGINNATATFLVSVACANMMLNLRKYGQQDASRSRFTGSGATDSFGGVFSVGKTSRAQRSVPESPLPIHLTHQRNGSVSSTLAEDPYATHEEKIPGGIRIEKETIIAHSIPDAREHV